MRPQPHSTQQSMHRSRPYVVCEGSGTPALAKETLLLLRCADLLLFTATANTSIVTLNLSLMINTVGFYQVPLPIACCVCMP